MNTDETRLYVYAYEYMRSYIVSSPNANAFAKHFARCCTMNDISNLFRYERIMRLQRLCFLYIELRWNEGHITENHADSMEGLYNEIIRYVIYSPHATDEEKRFALSFHEFNAYHINHIKYIRICIIAQVYCLLLYRTGFLGQEQLLSENIIWNQLELINE